MEIEDNAHLESVESCNGSVQNYSEGDVEESDLSDKINGTDSESELSAAIFGDKEGEDGLFEILKKRALIRDEREALDSAPEPPGSPTFYCDFTGDQRISENFNLVESNPNLSHEHNDKAAWVDDDDAQVEISTKKILRKLRTDYTEKIIPASQFETRLRIQYEKLYPPQKWAAGKERIGDLDPKDFSDLLRTTSNIIECDSRQSTIEHKNDNIKVTRLKDFSNGPSKIFAMQFHKSYPILITGGADCVLRLHYIDDKANVLLESVYFKQHPITSIAHTADSKEIIICGNNRHYYAFDIKDHIIKKYTFAGFASSRMRKSLRLGAALIKGCVCSNDGKFLAFSTRSHSVLIVLQSTKQVYAELPTSGIIDGIHFSPLDNTLFVLIRNQCILIFDVTLKKCVHKFFNNGDWSPRSIKISPNGEYIAIGSISGVVNIYNSKSCMETQNPTPLKSIMNLTTIIDVLEFSPDSQILAIASSSKKNALRLFNTRSLRVFKNWPTANTPLGYTLGVSFSRLGEYIAITNTKGRGIIYSLDAYRR